MRSLESLAGALAVITLLRPSAPAMHNHLVKADPAIDTSITKAPQEIILWFAEPPDVALSDIRLRSARDTTQLLPTSRVTVGGEPTAIKVAVTTTLTPGSYQVLYRTAGDDGHVLRSRYSFTLRQP